ncbi:MAG: hypothetical protein WC319_02560 [Candidatus Paceibacterota bacterium]|jgi:hypothetical protein
MELNLTNEQFRDLLKSVVIGSYIRETYEEINSRDFSKVNDVQDYLLSVAKDFGASDMV